MANIQSRSAATYFLYMNNKTTLEIMLFVYSTLTIEISVVSNFSATA